MSETSTEAHQTALLRIFHKAKDGRLSAGPLQQKLVKGPHAGLSAPQADHALATLIERGHVATSGGTKDGPHPRKNASYRITDQGRHHLRPARPKHSDEILENQEAFILLQVFRSTAQQLTRSKLNEKLKTQAAKIQLEFNLKEAPETVDYHLAALVEKNALIEQRRGISVSFTLDPERGLSTLVLSRQGETVGFTLTGKVLNALLAAARGSAPAPTLSQPEDEPTAEEPLAEPPTRPVGPDEIEAIIDRLQAGPYAGKDLIPIHEVRRLVAEHHGAQAASHASFDPVLLEMRSDERLNLIAISDNRRATSEQLDDAIPGMNETIFYIVVK